MNELYTLDFLYFVGQLVGASIILYLLVEWVVYLLQKYF